MLIEINGERRELSQPVIILRDLIEQLSLTPQRIAVEVNKQIVPRDKWARTTIRDGDQIEIVHFVGGGKQHEADGRRR